MTATERLIRAITESTLQDAEMRQYLEKLVINLLKKGCTLPDYDSVIRIAVGLGDSMKGDVTPADVANLTEIAVGLALLSQICLTKERM